MTPGPRLTPEQARRDAIRALDALLTLTAPLVQTLREGGALPRGAFAALVNACGTARAALITLRHAEDQTR